MSPLWMQTRRAWLQTAAATAASLALRVQAQDDETVRRGRVLVFPRDHGAHLQARIEWWYATGWLGSQTQPVAGFQLTFFRSLTGLARDSRSRFAGRHLLFAHAAWTQLQPSRTQAQLGRFTGLGCDGQCKNQKKYRNNRFHADIVTAPKPPSALQ